MSKDISSRCLTEQSCILTDQTQFFTTATPRKKGDVGGLDSGRWEGKEAIACDGAVAKGYDT